MYQLKKIESAKPAPSLFGGLSGARGHALALGASESQSRCLPIQTSPKVAILLCTYHGKHYLSEQLSSFADQTHTHWEVGWMPAETFKTGIRKTVQWYLDNPDCVANVQSGGYRAGLPSNMVAKE